MGQRGRQLLTDQRVFFVTTSTKRHEMLFDTPDKLASLLNIISGVVEKHEASLYGYVLMSNHLHLLLGLTGGGPQLSAFMRDVKSLAWRELFRTRRGIWAARFDDVAIYSEELFRAKLNYIHNNPVKAGLTRRPDEYRFSSAKAWLTGEADGLVTLTAPF